MLDSPEFTAPAMTNKDMREQELALSEKKTPYVFSLKGQLLDQGRTDSVLAATDDLTIRLKVYASGGENELHAHPYEDHSFMILQGSARFFGPEDEEIELGQWEGIMLPRGNLYKFFATSKEPLVMIRVGNRNQLALTKKVKKCVVIQKKINLCQLFFATVRFLVIKFKAKTFV